MGYPTQLGLWVGRSQALVAKKILFLSNWGSKRAGPQKLVAKEFLPLSNGSFKEAESCSQERKKLLVKFKVQKISKQRVPEQIQNTTGPGHPGAKPGSGSGGPGLLSPHSPVPLATRWPYPRGWREWAIQGWKESETPRVVGAGA